MNKKKKAKEGKELVLQKKYVEFEKSTKGKKTQNALLFPRTKARERPSGRGRTLTSVVAVKQRVAGASPYLA